MTTKNLEKLAEIGERKFLKNLNPRIETKTAVGKIMKNKYAPQSQQNYHKRNSELNIPRYN